MSPIRAVIAVCAALAFGACFGGEDADLSGSGKGKPVAAVEFPATTDAGEVYEAKVTVENPGPGDIRVLRLAFALIGPQAGQQDFPAPLVETGLRSDDPDIVAVSPEPQAVSTDGLVLNFALPVPDDCDPDAATACEAEPFLPAGGSRTITLRLRVPEDAGAAANSLQVFDGQEVDRGTGVRLETVVQG